MGSYFRRRCCPFRMWGVMWLACFARPCPQAAHGALLHLCAAPLSSMPGRFASGKPLLTAPPHLCPHSPTAAGPPPCPCLAAPQSRQAAAAAMSPSLRKLRTGVGGRPPTPRGAALAVAAAAARGHALLRCSRQEAQCRGMRPGPLNSYAPSGLTPHRQLIQDYEERLGPAPESVRAFFTGLAE